MTKYKVAWRVFFDAVILLWAFVVAATLLRETARVPAIYITLAATSWFVGINYAHKTWIAWNTLDLEGSKDFGTFLLLGGISCGFTGYALDQTIWAATAAFDSISADWVQKNLQWLVLLSKGLCINGGMIHVRVSFRHQYPNLTVRSFGLYMIVAWGIVALLLTYY